MCTSSPDSQLNATQHAGRSVYDLGRARRGEAEEDAVLANHQAGGGLLRREQDRYLSLREQHENGTARQLNSLLVTLLLLSPIAGELVNRLSADCTVLQNAVTVNISMVLRELASAIGGITILFVISWKVLQRPLPVS
jgi:ABC-type multidrug transport system fused ATPase/permease subunit